MPRKKPVNPKIMSAAPAAGVSAGPGKQGCIVMAFGLALIAVGYILLKKADPAGENIYAKLAPLALLAGYLLIPAALCVRGNPAGALCEPKESGPQKRLPENPK